METSGEESGLQWAHFELTLNGMVDDCANSRPQPFVTFNAKELEAPLSLIFDEAFLVWLNHNDQKKRRKDLPLYGVNIAGSRSNRKISVSRNRVELPLAWMPKHWVPVEQITGNGAQARADGPVAARTVGS